MTSHTWTALARSEAGPLVRWTALAGFAAGFGWTIPAVALLSSLGPAGWAALPALGIGAAVGSAAQAHLVLTEDFPDRVRAPSLERSVRPIEWTLGLGGIGPNLAVAAWAARVAVDAAPPLGLASTTAVALVAGFAAVGATFVFALPVQALGLPIASALTRADEGSGWRRLSRVGSTWVAGQLCAAAALAAWIL
ncbi:MAG: hypothetical protein ABMB14_33920, partial [Myxococcota bacterium]